MTSTEENWAFAKALLFASPFAAWLFWAMGIATPKLATAGGIIVVAGVASAFTAGLLIWNAIVRGWRPWQRYAAAVALVTLTLLLGYLVMTAEWLRYPVG